MKNCTYSIRKFLSVFVVLFTISSMVMGQQVARGLTAANNQFIGFYEYKPTDYDANPTTKYPLIIFLHGIGERGNGTSNLSLVLGNGIPRYINAGHPMRFFWNGKWETFMVLSPQLSTSYGDWQNFYVDEMLNYAKNNLRVDTNRIILTGLSLGGGGTWKYASTSLANAKKFAAIAPVCGTCNMIGACNLASANLPVWAFHAQDDGVVGVGCTTSSVQSINNCNPAVKPLMTIYSSGNHYIWDRAYDTVYNYQNPNIYEWFLGQNKSKPVNQAPVANAGPDQTIALPTTNVVLNGSASYDPDGSIARYSWRKLSGPAVGVIQTPGNATSNLTGLTIAGTYVYELKISDDRVSIKYDTVQITVNTAPPGTNLLPVAVAGPDQTINTSSVTITSWGSTDPDGSIVGYLWKKVSGPATYFMQFNIYASCTIDNLVSGTYQFELQVTDNAGGIGRDTVQVTVNLGTPAQNQAPNANAGSDITLTLPTNATNLIGAGSSDPDGTISTYSWARISGPTQVTIANAAAANTAISNLVQGTYGFQLTVTDNGGLTDKDTVFVTVNAAPVPNGMPVANAGTDIVLTLPTNNTTLNGTGSYDPENNITSYTWSKVSGPTQFTIGNTATASTSLSNLVQGTYVFRIVVFDNVGQWDDDSVTVTVNAAPPPPNVAPNANAGTDISITLPVNNTTLNGSASNDPDGTIASYSWTRISGPTQVTITNAAAASTAISNLVQGTYGFRLVVTDNNGATDSDTVLVTVNAAIPPPNVAPNANAGTDISITLPVNNTTLNGSASNDPDGTIASYSWTRISGPTQVTITNAAAASTAISNLVQGTYGFRLVVTDNNGATDSDTVLVTVNAAIPPPNVAPNANAGTDISITLPVNNTTLNGSASNDPDGTIASYSWTRISGPTQVTIGNASAASTAISNLVQGTYGFRLVVTDNNGATDSDTVLVTVNAAIPPPNVAPNANAGTDINITLPVNNTTLNGSASNDPDGTIASYSWTRISGPTQVTIGNASAASTAISNLVQGTYGFRLVVTDNNGATNSDTVLVTVNAAIPPPNVAPNANAGIDISITLPVNNTTLNGSASNDPDGTIASYSWTRISGPTQVTIGNAAAASTAISNLVQGTYGFRLVVTDNNGATDSDTVLVTVNPAPNAAPVANAGTDISITLPTNSTNLNGSASYDPDGSIAQYNWTRISGPGAVTITNSTTATPGVVGLQAGQHIFELMITDDKGATATDRVTVTVNAAPVQNQAPIANAGNDSSISVPATTALLNGSASYDSDGTIASYTWKQLNGPATASIQSANSATSTIVNLQTGEYQFELTVTDNNGASSKDTVFITVINTMNSKEGLVVYPNPVKDQFNLRCVSDSLGNARYTIYTSSGNMVRSGQFVKGQSYQEIGAIYVGNLKTGMYYLEVMIGDRKRMITKFIKQ